MTAETFCGRATFVRNTHVQVDSAIEGQRSEKMLKFFFNNI